jgi:hypothetical protein
MIFMPLITLYPNHACHKNIALSSSGNLCPFLLAYIFSHCLPSYVKLLMGFLYLRFGPSSLHQRDPRSALFEGYDSGAGGRPRNGSSSPSRPGYGGPYGYPAAGNGSVGLGLGSERPAYRPATPNSRYVAMCGKGLQLLGNRTQTYG